MRKSAARRGIIELTHPVDVFLRIGARILLSVALGVYVLIEALGNLPEDPEGSALTEDILVPLQLGLLVVVAIGLLLSFRSMALGAAVTAFGGAGVSVLSALQFDFPIPIAVFIAFLVPAVMMWLDWQCRETVSKIVVLAIVTTVLFSVSWIGSNRLYAHFFGPTHPESVSVALADSSVQWAWSGAVDPQGFSVTARMREPSDEVRLIVTAPNGVEVNRSPSAIVDEAENPVRFDITGLDPNTEYRYAVESDGVVDQVRTGAVTTFPAGPASLTLAFGGCALTSSNGAVFDTIRQMDPDLYVITGDMHYRNIASDNAAAFAAAYDQVHDSPGQSHLYRTIPVAYVWDDHDFGGNNSDSRSPSRPAAWSAYRGSVPHYELSSGPAGAINQAFTVGRVRIIMIDTRSHRLESAGTLLGEQQLGWLFDELASARDTHALTILVSPTPWIGPENAGGDDWGAFAAERARLGAFLDHNRVDNLVLVGGDAHMLAIDDGTNSGYGGDDGFPVLQAAALDRPGSEKGGPYTHGTFPGGGQFGVIEIADDGGDNIGVELIGLDWTGQRITSLATTFVVPVGS